MSQIYNGTFLLGNTSATTLSAGPGIKLDTSVPGTIKISNDETVLWEGSTTNSDIELSETITNFEYLRIDFSITLNNTVSNWSFNSIAKLFPTDKIMNNKRINLNDMVTDGSAVNSLVIRVVNLNINDAGNKLTYRDSYQLYFNGASWTAGAATIPIYKVTGINRISGNA